MKDIAIYSDGCGSQNRNVTLSNALSTLARDKGITIAQNYLEKGHTQMECDSVHSVIERKKKPRNLHTRTVCSADTGGQDYISIQGPLCQSQLLQRFQ